MLKLYDYPDCPFCQKVRVVLAEKDLEYEKVFVDLRKQEQKTPEFLRMNPYGKVPVLVDDDEVIYDSTIINEYLEDEYPLPRLMPEDSQGRAQVRLLEDYCDNSFIPPTTMLLAQLRKPEAERDAQRVEQAREELRRCLYFLRDQLDGNEYLVGHGVHPRRCVLRAAHDGARAARLRVRAGARAGAGVARSHPLPSERAGSRTVAVTNCRRSDVDSWQTSCQSGIIPVKRSAARCSGTSRWRHRWPRR